MEYFKQIMRTIIEQVSSDNPEKNMPAIKTAAKILSGGGLVAFPTETVYGLGANALDPFAVKKIFKAKGRPSDNPLIVHVSSIEDFEQVVSDIPPLAYTLAEAFWPGPLTMILPKAKIIPLETTAGLSTVAVRIPDNKTATLLIKEAGVPIAAPSANSSGKPSSTLSSHVELDLDGKIDMIIDSGPVKIGIESTVVDLSVSPPCVLRPGFITLDMLKKIDNSFESGVGHTSDCPSDSAPKSPGVKYTHYSPTANLIIISGENESMVGKIKELAYANKSTKKTGILTCCENFKRYNSADSVVISVGKRSNMETITPNLFTALRTFDYKAVDIIIAEAFPSDGLGASVMDRLTKASGNTIISV